MRKVIINVLILTQVIFLMTNISLAEEASSQLVPKMPGIERIEGADIERVEKEKVIPDAGSYLTIIIDPFEASDEIKKNYRFALRKFRTGLIKYLQKKNVFTKVIEGEDSNDNRAVKLTGKILDISLVSYHARMVGFEVLGVVGAAASGSSHMDVYLKLTDNKTGKIINEKIITTYNNPFGSIFSSSDATMPTDMGAIVGEYLCAIMGKRGN